MVQGPKLDMVKELAKLYEMYEITKLKLNHYHQIRWNILRRMGRSGPHPIGSPRMDGQPGASDVFNFEAEAQSLLKVEQTIGDLEEEIEAYETLFKDIHEMFSRYKNNKYSVLVLRMSGKTNAEIADQLNLSEERVRHIVVELNQELRERKNDTSATL